MTVKKIFVLVTCAALAGMVMGALFGLVAGLLTPQFFAHIIPWRDVEPLGFALVAGATGGVLLGGGLGSFGVIVQCVMEWKRKQAS
jgi:hypothetical protein